MPNIQNDKWFLQVENVIAIHNNKERIDGNLFRKLPKKGNWKKEREKYYVIFLGLVVFWS